MHINTSPQQRNLQANEHTLDGQYYMLVSHDNVMSSSQKDTEVQMHQRHLCFILLGLMLFSLQADLAESCCSVQLKQGLRPEVEVGIVTSSHQAVCMHQPGTVCSTVVPTATSLNCSAVQTASDKAVCDDVKRCHLCMMMS